MHFCSLFKRVSDCIRDTAVQPTDNYGQVRIKYWAQPQCNQILRVLNQNWNSLNGLAVLTQQESLWQGVASNLYGVRANSQMCGVANYLVNCWYVTP